MQENFQYLPNIIFLISDEGFSSIISKEAEPKIYPAS